MCLRNISRFGWVLLVATLTIIVLVHVLPQVDLLDTAFHGNTAPLVVHALGTVAPLLMNFSLTLHYVPSAGGSASGREFNDSPDAARLDGLQILNSTLRC